MAFSKKTQAVDMPEAISNRINGKIAKSVEIVSTGKPGKPKRPKGISNADWGKHIGGMRMLKALKAIKGIARLNNADSYEFSDKQKARMISDLERHVEMVKTAFENPSKAVKSVERYW